MGSALDMRHFSAVSTLKGKTGFLLGKYGNVKKEGRLVTFLRYQIKKLKEVPKLFIRNAGIFDDSLECIGVKPFMLWNGDVVSSVRHADVFTSGYNLTTCFTECPDSTLSRDISKEHTKQEPLLHKQWHLLSLQLSSGGRF